MLGGLMCVSASTVHEFAAGDQHCARVAKLYECSVAVLEADDWCLLQIFSRTLSRVVQTQAKKEECVPRDQKWTKACFTASRKGAWKTDSWSFKVWSCSGILFFIVLQRCSGCLHSNSKSSASLVVKKQDLTAVIKDVKSGQKRPQSWFRETAQVAPHPDQVIRQMHPSSDHQPHSLLPSCCCFMKFCNPPPNIQLCTH